MVINKKEYRELHYIGEVINTNDDMRVNLDLVIKLSDKKKNDYIVLYCRK